MRLHVVALAVRTYPCVSLDTVARLAVSHQPFRHHHRLSFLVFSMSGFDFTPALGATLVSFDISALAMVAVYMKACHFFSVLLNITRVDITHV